MLEYKAETSNVTRMVMSGMLSKRLNLFKKSVVSLMSQGRFASRGWSSLSRNADTYSVNVQMPDTNGRPGGLMLSRLASMMKLSGLKLGQVDITRLGSLCTFGKV